MSVVVGYSMAEREADSLYIVFKAIMDEKVVLVHEGSLSLGHVYF